MNKSSNKSNNKKVTNTISSNKNNNNSIPSMRLNNSNYDFNDSYSNDVTLSRNSDYDENVSTETEQALLKAFEVFFARESEMILSTLEESRENIRSTIDDLVYEQDKHKEELFKATEGKYDVRRKKENSIPLSEYIKKKRNIASARTSSSVMIPMSSTPLNDEISSDKLAVEKYLKKRERQKLAESNRLRKEATELHLEEETKNILDKLKGIDMNKEKERQRQMEKLQAKLKGKPQEKDHHVVATEIIENYQDSQLAHEREKKQQQQKFQSRLNATRDKRAVTPTGRDLTDSDLRDNSANGYGKHVPQVDI